MRCGCTEPCARAAGRVGGGAARDPEPAPRVACAAACLGRLPRRGRLRRCLASLPASPLCFPPASVAGETTPPPPPLPPPTSLLSQHATDLLHRCRAGGCVRGGTARGRRGGRAAPRPPQTPARARTCHMRSASLRVSTLGGARSYRPRAAPRAPRSSGRDGGQGGPGCGPASGTRCRLWQVRLSPAVPSLTGRGPGRRQCPGTRQGRRGTRLGYRGVSGPEGGRRATRREDNEAHTWLCWYL